MIKITFFIFLIIAICSCNSNNCKNINCVRPFTQKEIKFLDSLEKKGYTYQAWRFNYPFSGDTIDCCIQEVIDEYSLYINNYEYEKVKNIDSMRETSKKIAVEIYSKILSDSVINYTSGFDVIISGKSQKKHKILRNRYGTRFKKEDLEKYCGFLVKENPHGILNRENIIKKSDVLPTYQEYIIP